MPVLTVSVNTWPHVGFSRNRSIRPSSPATTRPNSSGSGTRLSTTVTSASVLRWASMTAVRSMSVSASPLITTKVSSRSRDSAFFTLPAVPSGVSSVAYVRLMPRSWPSPK